MADYITQDMTVRSLVDDILRTDVPPAGAQAWGFFDDNGALVSVPLGDLGAPAAPAGTGLATAIYEAQATGAQTVAQPGATWFGDVGIVTSGGKSIPLSYGTGYTFTAGSLSLLAAAGVQVNDLVTYTYASGAVNGQQPAPAYAAGTGIAISPANVISATTGLTPAQQAALSQVSAPIVGLVGGVAQGYATLLDAINARPSVLRLNMDVVLTATPSRRFDGLLLGNGSTITVASGAELQLTRYTNLDQCPIAGAGAISIIGSGVPSASAPVPVPQDCVQIVNSPISASLNFLPASNYQGLALRGNSTVTNLASGGGPVYLYDLAEVNQPLPAGFTLYDKRPGMGGPSTGIDYNNPVTLSAAATLQPNKAYYLTGSGYALTLPSASANLGAAIYVEVASNATGLYAVGAQLLRAVETLIVRATPGGWAISTKQLVPLVARIETALSQQDSFNGVFFVPFSVTMQDAVGMATLPGVIIQRSGQYILTTGGALKNASGSDQNVISLLANPNTADEKLLVSNGTAITQGGIGDAFVTYTGYLAAGTVLRTRFYCGAGAALRGQVPGAQLFLTVTEIA